MFQICRTIGWFPLALALSVAAPACRQESGGGTTSDAEKTAAKPADLLIFPEPLRVADAAVNEFVTTAMTICAKGDYEAFRLLWSARETPLPRDEFEQGWNAARRIEVCGLQKGIVEADPKAGREQEEVVYALLAEVDFDATLKAGQKQPKREVVLMLMLEHDRWRLAKAPRSMREWIKSKTGAAESAPADPPPDRPVQP